MPRASKSRPRPAPDAPFPSASAAPAARPSGRGAEGAPGNGLLVFFGAIAVIFGFLSTVELLFGRGAGPVFIATLGVCVLMVVLAAAYKAGWRLPRRRRKPLPRPPRHPPDAPPASSRAVSPEKGSGTVRDV